MHRGSEAAEGMPTRQLFEAVVEAEGVGIENLEGIVLNGSRTDPLLALRVLERRSPEDWARRERIELSTAEKPMDTDELRKLILERLEKYIVPDAPAAQAIEATVSEAVATAEGGNSSEPT